MKIDRSGQSIYQTKAWTFCLKGYATEIMKFKGYSGYGSTKLQLLSACNAHHSSAADNASIMCNTQHSTLMG
jgi:hypothetical protein